jgi:anaerobic selenocysteine-containing dehydrogenase
MYMMIPGYIRVALKLLFQLRNKLRHTLTFGQSKNGFKKNLSMRNGTSSSNTPGEWKATACNLCYANCGLLVKIEGRRILRIRGDKSHPASRGYTCNKAQRLGYYQSDKNRLTTPLRRGDDGTYEEIDWDTAISEIATKMTKIRNTFGGDKIFRYGGGGQGNHLGGSYFSAVMAALEVRYKSNALAQEKTGYAWMMQRTFGTHVHGDLEHAQCLFIVGKNPWQSNGIQQSRILLKEASKDPDRTLIIMDPRQTESADLADIHLAVKPGRDAWALAAMVATIFQENLLPHKWLSQHTIGLNRVQQRFESINVDAYAEFAGIVPDDLKMAARAIATAESSVYYEDLGIQMAPHSTLASYLNLLIIALTGHYGRPNTMAPLKSLIGQFLDASDIGEADERGYEKAWQKSPVANARIVGGLVPCNVIPEEILTDHPDRYRAMFIESSNPCHSLADSERWRRAIRALDCSVVIDIAMTETAQQADYVLPASSQYEKWESTFFNFEYPENYHHLRAPLFEPLPGTLPEPEIHARLIEALQPFDLNLLTPLEEAAKQGLEIYGLEAIGFFNEHRELRPYIAYILYRTLGPALPADAASASVYFGLAQRFASKHPDAVKRAGISGLGPMLGINLFRAILQSPSGVTFAVSDQGTAFDEIGFSDNRIRLAVGEMLDEVESLSQFQDTIEHSEEFPFLLAAGERRAYTANTIIRDPEWMKANNTASLSIHPDDAVTIGVCDGEQVKVTTQSGEAIASAHHDRRMKRGTISLPNGLGLLYPDHSGVEVTVGVPPNELTALDHRDKFVGTPFHKHVLARVEAIAPAD